MSSLADRFEAKVDRTGAHHLWTGSKRADGAGQLKVNGRTVTAHRVAWELAHGPLPAGAHVRSCPEDRACVRVNHMSLHGQPIEAPAEQRRRRASPGAGSMTEIRPGVWKFTVARGRYADGSIRRAYRTIRAGTEPDARRELAGFVAEVDQDVLPESRDERDITINAAIERYLEEHLRGEKGREELTIRGYRQIHEQWFSPVIGQHRVRDVDDATFDRILGEMQRAGRSSSRMKAALNLYRPFFRWAKRRRIISRSPLTDFELPKSKYVAKPRIPPEIDQLCLLLATAVEHTPDVAPVLTLAAVTGMRRGELVAVRRSGLDPMRGTLYVGTAADVVGTKLTKTRTSRHVSLDNQTVDMLQRHNKAMDERAALFDVEVAVDAFIFSLEADCSERMAPAYVTRQVAILKDLLGIPDKRPETIMLEDEALRLFRGPADRPPGRPGPRSKGSMSYPEIGRRLGRSSKWAFNAVASAQRRETAAERDDLDSFDGSILGLRKFTSSELLDSGFNVSAVAERQGHGPQVLTKHYSKTRRSADRKAADHLGRLVHRTDPVGNESNQTPSL